VFRIFRAPSVELFPPRPTPRLTRRFWTLAAVALVAANALALSAPQVAAWIGGPYRPITAPPPDYVEPRQLTIGADPNPPPPRPPRPTALHQAVILLAVNALVVSALAFAVLARYLEDLRRYRLVLPTGFDERRLRPRHRRAPGLDVSTTPHGSRFRRLGLDDDDELDDEL
jgi:hypothetical protein